MKKLLLTLCSLLLCLALVLSSCGKTPDENKDDGKKDPTEEGKKDPPEEGGEENPPEEGGEENPPEEGGEEPPEEEPYAPVHAPSTGREAYTLGTSHDVLGEGIGVNPGRVVWEYDPEAFDWDGKGYWWNEDNFDEDAIVGMFTDGLLSLTDTETEKDAWDAIFGNFNWRVYGTSSSVVYKKGEKIAIKANMNCCGTGTQTQADQTSGLFSPPVLLRAILTSLVNYGVSPADITVYDASRRMPSSDFVDYCSAGNLSGVRFVCYDPEGPLDAVPDTEYPIEWSGTVNGSPTFYPTCVTEADYLINLVTLKGHTLAGFTASAKNHYGTVMPGEETKDGYTFPDAYRKNPPVYAGLHEQAAANNAHGCTRVPLGSYTALTDLLANADCGGKTVLYIADALATTRSQNGTLTMTNVWEMMDGEFPNSVFFSQDPVAIDSVCYDFLIAERDMELAKGLNVQEWNDCLPQGNTAENYLHEAALAYDPPSGTTYQDGYGTPVPSLGVHEHWNNPTDKQYSRNLGKDEGIELVQRINDPKN